MGRERKARTLIGEALSGAGGASSAVFWNCFSKFASDALNPAIGIAGALAMVSPPMAAGVVGLAVALGLVRYIKGKRDAAKEEAFREEVSRLAERAAAGGDVLADLADGTIELKVALDDLVKKDLADCIAETLGRPDGVVRETLREEFRALFGSAATREQFNALLENFGEFRETVEILLWTIEHRTREHTELLRWIKRAFEGRRGERREATDNFADAQISRNERFVGREEELGRLHELLTAGNAQITQAVVGEGGIGKSELAKAYVLDERYASHWAGRWWLDASEEAIEAATARLARKVQRCEIAEGMKPEEIRAALVDALSRGRHLLVLDNVEEPRRAREYKPTGDARVLITTRRRDIPATVAGRLELEVLELQDAVALLRAGRPDLNAPEHSATLKEISEHLGCHALAVAVAGGRLSQPPFLSPRNVLNELRNAEVGSPEDPFEEEDPEQLGTGYRRKVAESLALHLKPFEGGDGWALLKAAAFCHPEAIPIDLLAEAAGVDERVARGTLAALHKVSIVRCDAAVRIHHLMQAVMRARMGRVERAMTCVRLVRALHRRFADPFNHENWTTQSVHDPHAAAVLMHAQRLGDSELAAKLAYQRGLFLLNSCARFEVAEEMFEISLAIHKRIYGLRHLKLVGHLANRAIVQRNLGRISDAERSFSEVLVMCRQLCKGDHIYWAESLNNLAELRREQGRWEEAESLHVESLAMFRRLYKGDHPAVAMSLHNLATLQEVQARWAEAEPLYEAALAMRRRLFKGDHPDIAHSLNGLAIVRSRQSRLLEAEQLFEESLAIRKRLHKGDHPDVALGLRNLADIREMLGRLSEAETLQEAALAMRRRFFEGDHPDIAASMESLAIRRAQQGRLSEAEALFTESLAMYRRLHKCDHPDLATSISNFGRLLWVQSRMSEAEPLFEEALAMRRRLFQGDHPTVAESLTKLAAIRSEQGRKDDARPLILEAAAIVERLFQLDHPTRQGVEDWKRQICGD